MSNAIEFVINGVDKFSPAFGKLSASLESVVKKTAKMAAVATGTATAVVLFAKANADAEDKVAKISQRLGFAVEELTAYHFAANQSAISTETFDMAVQRMARRSADAAQGTGEAVNALRELNIDAKKFNGLSLDEKMSTLATALEGVQNQSDKVRIAFKLFDSEGVSMLQMLNGGSEGLKKMKADAEFLGAVMSKQATANATAFSDAMGRLGAASSGTSRAIADKLIPLLTGFANAAANAIAKSRGAIADFAEKAINGILFFYAYAEKIFTNIKKIVTFSFDKKTFEDFMISFTNMIQNMFNFTVSALPAVGKFFIAVFKGIGDSIMAIGKWASKNFINYFKGGEIKSLGDLLFESIPKATEDARNRMKAAFDSLKNDTAETGSAMASSISDTLGLSVNGLQNRVDELKNKFTQMGAVVNDTTANNATTVQSFSDILIQKWNDQMAAQGAVMEQLAAGSLAIINQTTDAISKSVADTIVYGGSLAKALEGIMKSVTASIIQMLVKVALQQVVTSGIVNAAQMKDALIGIAGGAAKAASNAYAAIAAIPYVGPFLAPAAAIAAGAAVFSLGRSLLGQAHDGMTDVPQTGTYLLQAGERVVKRDQNADLTSFLNNGGTSQGVNGGGQPISIGQLVIHVLENASNSEALLNMSSSEIRTVVAEKFIPALDELSKMGVKPMDARNGR